MTFHSISEVKLDCIKTASKLVKKQSSESGFQSSKLFNSIKVSN